MIDSQNLDVQLSCNHSILVRASTTNHTTSDAGALPMRELIDTTGILPYLVEHLHDPRDPYRTTHSTEDLLLQLFLPTIQGWESPSKDLGNDPAFRVALSTERGESVVLPDNQPASQPTMSRFWSILGAPDNVEVMQKGLLKLGMEHMLVRNGGEPLDEVILDIDAMPVDAHGNQLGSKYNGHYKRTVFLPLFVTCGETGDVLGAELRPGTQREATNCQNVMIPIGEQVQAHAAKRVTCRFDAGFNSPEVYEDLESKGLFYVTRLKDNNRLKAMAEAYFDGKGCPPNTYGYVELMYQAKSWNRPRRVVMIVRPRPVELYEDYFFLLTNLDQEMYTGEELAKMYAMRGKAEKHQGEIKELMSQVMLSSTERPKEHYRGHKIIREQEPETVEETEVRSENTVRLLSVLYAYQMMHIGRCLQHSPAPEMIPNEERIPVISDTEVDLDTSLKTSIETRVDDAQNTDDRIVVVPSTEIKPVASATDADLDASLKINTETMVDDTQDMDDRTQVDSKPKHTPYMQTNTFRLHLLKVGATIARHSRYVTFSIALSAEQLWICFWDHLLRLRWHCLPDI